MISFVNNSVCLCHLVVYRLRCPRRITLCWRWVATSSTRMHESTTRT